MRNEFFRAVLARLVTVTVSLGAGLLSFRLYADNFSPSALGGVVVTMQLIAYLPLLDGGFRTCINRRLLAAEGDDKDGLLAFGQTLYSWLLVVALLGGLAVVGSYGWFFTRHHPADSPPSEFFFWMAAAGAAAFFLSSQVGLLLGLGKQTYASLLSALMTAVTVATLAISLRWNAKFWSFPISLFCGSFVSYAVGIFLIRRRHPRLRLLSWCTTPLFWERFHQLRGEAWHAFRTQTSIVFLFSADIILVGLLCSAKDAAVYGVLSRLFAIARGFLGAFSEAAWPFFAKRSDHAERFSGWLLRSNGWIYGLAGGGLLLLTGPFLGWYLGPAWRPPDVLCAIFVARFLVIGASSPASYHLYGQGDFRAVARCSERETMAAVVLGVIGGLGGGMVGIATAFLLATGAGSFVPLVAAFARQRGLPLGALLLEIWVRVAGGFILSLILVGSAFSLIRNTSPLFHFDLDPAPVQSKPLIQE